MNLYEVSPIEVTLLGYASHLVAAASKKQAADMVADHLNCRQTSIHYESSDFYVYEIDIDSIRKPTVIF